MERLASVTGPVAGGSRGWPFGAAGDLQPGYVEEEYFLEGDAVRYKPQGELSPDGNWTLAEDSSAPYKTRILVRRPVSNERFNGTVIVEWANVSAGYEIAFLDPQGIYRNGFAYVAVTAQRNGLTGFEQDPKGLLVWDEQRYGTLSIADDALSYDIFTQAALAVGPDRAKSPVDPMGGLSVKRLIGIGESQSGSRILSYANGVQPLTHVFDALFPIICAGRGCDFDAEPAHTVVAGRKKVRNVTAKVREDLSCKVFMINSQTEACFYGKKMRQPDTAVFRYWDVAGAAHAPAQAMREVQRRLQRDCLSDLPDREPDESVIDIEWLPVCEAAIHHLQDWIGGKGEPPVIPPMELGVVAMTYRSDSLGNVLGGVRLPQIAVPVAKYQINVLKGLGGTRIPFPEKVLKRLYPTFEDYLEKYIAAAKKACEDGVLLPFRVEGLIEQAETAKTLW